MSSLSSTNDATLPVDTHHAAGNPLENAGVFLVVVFLFLTFSRAADLFVTGLRLPLIISVAAIAVASFSGGLTRALFSGAGLLLTAFTLWLMLAVPFSSWPGGSFQMLTDVWLKSFLVFVIIAGLLRSAAHCRQAMTALAAAAVAVSISGLTIGATTPEGRLVIGSGVLSNSNDLALLLLLNLPFLVLVAGSKTNSLVTRVLASVAVLPIMVVTARTGSRSAIPALAVCLAGLLFDASWWGRLKMVAGVVLAAALIVPVMSAEQRLRFLTILDDQPLEALTADQRSAIESKAQRVQLFWESVDVTLRNPVFGVGPGVFASASAQESEQSGETAAWRDTHNIYTQVSSEAGFPAFVMYVGALLASIATARSTYNRHKGDPCSEMGRMAYALWMSLLIYAVMGVFATVAYQIFLPTLAGLAVALKLADRQASTTHVGKPAIRYGLLAGAKTVPRIALSDRR